MPCRVCWLGFSFGNMMKKKTAMGVVCSKFAAGILVRSYPVISLNITVLSSHVETTHFVVQLFYLLINMHIKC